MHRETLERLACPACHARLSAASVDELVTGELECTACARTYEVRDGVPILLVGDAEDAWSDASARLSEAITADPTIEERLLLAPLPELNGSDLTFRGMVLEARGELEAAAASFDAADDALYGAELRSCRDRLLDACTVRAHGAAWVLDVASGRGALVERMARAGIQVLASDVSAVAMIRLRARLIGLGLGDRVDCVAADAAALPFGDHAVPTATSHLGLQNIPHPAQMLVELRRACAGSMLAVGHSYPPDDQENGDPLRTHGYPHVADRSVLDALLADAGWRGAYPELCRAPASPTPAGVVIPGGVVDGFPLASTVLEWYLLEAR